MSSTPYFTEEMKNDYTILIPNMAPIQFQLIKSAMESEGYHVEILNSRSKDVSQLGLRYVHNDTCYPALLVIGQYLDALNSGVYDLEHTALLITQTGGGCRASNYLKLLRKALVRAGYGNIPVASINVSGLEKESSLPLTLPLIEKLLAGVVYGDLLMALRNQIKPYEVSSGNAEDLVKAWTEKIAEWIRSGINCHIPSLKRKFREIVQSFAGIETVREPRVKVGIVGEIYVKFSPLGNNDLVAFLEEEGCEVNLPGLLGYLEYCAANFGLDITLYGGSGLVKLAADAVLKVMDSIGTSMNRALKECGFYAAESFRELMKKPEGILSLGAKMGEGWLLTAEMAELIEGGYENVICAQPFGCLPNHIAGKGVINRIRTRYPEANISAIDYDPGAARVNQENRIRLLLSVAREKLNQEITGESA